MTCSGCSGAVERVLKKTEGVISAVAGWHCGALTFCHDCAGVSSYEISLEKQEVLVNGSIGYDELLEKIKKTGKEVCGPHAIMCDARSSLNHLCSQVRSGEVLV